METVLERTLGGRKATALTAATVLLIALALGLGLTVRPAEAAVNANASTVSVNEGNLATMSGTYSNPLPGPTNTTITASAGSVTKTGTTSGTWSWSLPTSDGPSQSRTITITARHTGIFGISATETAQFSLNVLNVAPSAVFNRPASVDEGSAIALSLTNPTDPSFVDSLAGFSYAFGCPLIGPFGPGNSSSCSTNDSGLRTVSAAIRDKDNGVRNFSALVTVNNVAPTATFNAPSSVNPGSDFTISLTDPQDPSDVDEQSLKYAFDCGSGFGQPDVSSSATCTIGSASRTVRGKIVDKDGGETVYQKLVAINRAPSITNPRPAPGARIRDVTPLISAKVSDTGTNLAKSNIKLFLDGRRIAAFSYSSSTDRLVYVSKKLRIGKHTVRVEATDGQGLKATKSWSFRILPKR